jgi:hypothetical protein
VDETLVPLVEDLVGALDESVFVDLPGHQRSSHGQAGIRIGRLKPQTDRRVAGELYAGELYNTKKKTGCSAP